MGMLSKYKLVNGVPVETNDLMDWAEWIENNDNARKVAQTKIADGDDEILVSTVFLGLDHNFSGVGEPILFETLVFGGKLDGQMIRTTNKTEAKKAHARMVRRVKNAI